MPDNFDFEGLSQAIQEGISSGFTRVINQINSGNLGLNPSGTGGTGGTGGGGSGSGATPGGPTEEPPASPATTTTEPQVTPPSQEEVIGVEETLLTQAADLKKKVKEGIEGVFEDVV